MNFYILADDVQQVEKLYNKMARKYQNPPQITIGEPVMMECHRTTDMGYDGVRRDKWMANVRPVSIGEMSGEWHLVATVYYHEQLVVMGERELFKNMPEKFGLDYHTCDSCGHKCTKEAYVMYNDITKTYEQVGVSCFNKVFSQWKYYRKFIYDVCQYVKLSFGIDDMDFSGGSWYVPDHYAVKAIDYKDSIRLCLRFQAVNGDTWVKSYYDDRIKEYCGTNQDLQGFYSRSTDPEFYADVIADEDLVEKVFAYSQAQELAPADTSESNYSLQQKMRQATEVGCVQLREAFVAWFAIKGYLDSIQPNFEDTATRAGYVVGEKVLFEGEVVSSQYIEYDEYESYMYLSSGYFEYIFKDKNGIECRKNISSINAVDKYKQPDGTYRFHVTVKYIAKKNRYIGFGGRLSK